jgi:hypothetical protein
MDAKEAQEIQKEAKYQRECARKLVINEESSKAIQYLKNSLEDEIKDSVHNTDYNFVSYKEKFTDALEHVHCITRDYDDFGTYSKDFNESNNCKEIKKILNDSLRKSILPEYRSRGYKVDSAFVYW